MCAHDGYMHTATLSPPKNMAAQTADLIVSVSGLTKRYGDAAAVDDVSFTIPRGGVVGLLGPNGAGKTTVMKMLLGLVRPTSGEIDLLGTRVGSRGWGATLQRVGAIIEAPPIYERLTARDNLRYQALSLGLGAHDDRIDEILDLVGLADRADDRPRGYSLGMKQRLGIGITLVGSPELVILDEPANGLDPHGIIEIRNLLRRMPDMGVTVLVSSHQLSEVQQACDQLVILANGRTIAYGSTEEILAQHADNSISFTVAEKEMPDALGALGNFGQVSPLPPTTILVKPKPGVTVSGSEMNRALANCGVFAERITAEGGNLEEVFLDLTT